MRKLPYVVHYLEQGSGWTAQLRTFCNRHVRDAKYMAVTMNKKHSTCRNCRKRMVANRLAGKHATFRDA